MLAEFERISSELNGGKAIAVLGLQHVINLEPDLLNKVKSLVFIQKEFDHLPTYDYEPERSEKKSKNSDVIRITVG